MFELDKYSITDSVIQVGICDQQTPTTKKAFAIDRIKNK